MIESDLEYFWNAVANDWDIQVGEHGDTNRRFNSDPVLWQFASDVSGLVVLDAGCGTGYLSRQLKQKGAVVTGVDISEKMIVIARSKSSDVDYIVGSCTELGSLSDKKFDMVIANYMLMDSPDLESTLHAFNRVLKNDGIAIVIFSHPCFPQGKKFCKSDNNEIVYVWKNSYFERRQCIEPPWGHFTSDFIWFHRPLSDYWKAFKRASFYVDEFEEPRITPEHYHLAESEQQLKKHQIRPYSVAFRLVKLADIG